MPCSAVDPRQNLLVRRLGLELLRSMSRLMMLCMQKQQNGWCLLVLLQPGVEKMNRELNAGEAKARVVQTILDPGLRPRLLDIGLVPRWSLRKPRKTLNPDKGGGRRSLVEVVRHHHLEGVSGWGGRWTEFSKNHLLQGYQEQV